MRRAGVGARLVLGVLRGYQLLVSPLFTGSCRFTPSCSEYMAGAVRMHGVVAGVWLGLKRLGRCRPLGAYGLDPVPEELPSLWPGGRVRKVS